MMFLYVPYYKSVLFLESGKEVRIIWPKRAAAGTANYVLQEIHTNHIISIWFFFICESAYSFPSFFIWNEPSQWHSRPFFLWCEIKTDLWQTGQQTRWTYQFIIKMSPLQSPLLNEASFIAASLIGHWDF